MHASPVANAMVMICTSIFAWNDLQLSTLHSTRADTTVVKLIIWRIQFYISANYFQVSSWSWIFFSRYRVYKCGCMCERCRMTSNAMDALPCHFLVIFIFYSYLFLISIFIFRKIILGMLEFCRIECFSWASTNYHEKHSILQNSLPLNASTKHIQFGTKHIQFHRKHIQFLAKESNHPKNMLRSPIKIVRK